MAHYRSRRRAHRRYQSLNPLVGFLLIASFGILFAGCSGPDSQNDEYVFTEEDAAKFHQLAQEVQEDPQAVSGSGVTLSGSGSMDGPFLTALETGSGAADLDIPVLDLSMVKTYEGLRANGAVSGPSAFTVRSANLKRLNKGDTVEVIDFINASWARVKVDGGEGYVSTPYIAKLTTDTQLQQDQNRYAGQYFVNFRFVNLRKEKDAKSEKLAEVPGQTIVTPKAIEGDWMRIAYDGKEGYVSSGYLKPFLPNFIVRQDTFDLPIVQYRMGQEGVLKALTEHVARLKRDGMRFITLRDFSDVLLRDTKLQDNSVSLIVTGVSKSNVKEVSDTLNAAGIRATLFIQTKDPGINGITEKQVITLMANGFDLQSAGHTGDDLRALTNSQVELELKQSRQLLEQYTKRSVFAVAYPQGGVNDRVTQLAGESGYLFGITDGADASFSRSQFLRLPSLVVFPSTSADEVVRAAKGS